MAGGGKKAMVATRGNASVAPLVWISRVLNSQLGAVLQTFGFRPEKKNTGSFSQFVQGNRIPRLGCSHVQKFDVVITSAFSDLIQSHFWWRQSLCGFKLQGRKHLVLSFSPISGRAVIQGSVLVEIRSSQQPGLDFRERESVPKGLSYLFPSLYLGGTVVLMWKPLAH